MRDSVKCVVCGGKRIVTYLKENKSFCMKHWGEYEKQSYPPSDKKPSLPEGQMKIL